MRIGNTILTRVDPTNYWQNLGDYQDAEEYSDCTVYSYTAAASGLYNFKLAIFNKQTVGPRSGPEMGNTSWAVPFRMSLDGGTTWVPISNTSLSVPIFFLPEGSEKAIRDTNDNRDRYNYKPERKPGLLIKLWESPSVTSSSPVSGNSYPSTDAHIANMRRLYWSSASFVGDEVAATSTDRIWHGAQGPFITNGCSALAKSSTYNDQYFFDWFNATSWKCWSGNADSSVTDAWTKRLIGWFGSIYLRKGETVKFQGRVDDFWFLKIDDTWLADHEFYLDYDEGESPVHEFTASYTGYHQFKLMVVNVNTVGPRPSGANDYPKMSFNGTTWVDISNESFDTPRFFLPDDCDHEKYWNEGCILRDKQTNLQNVINTVYPIGSVYISMDGVNQPFPGSGTTWELIGQGKTLWGYDPDETPTPTSTGVTKDAGLPDIQGKVGQSADPADGEVFTGIDSDAPGNNADGTDHTKSALHLTDRTNNYGGLGSNAGSGYKTLSFEASRHNSIYGNSTTVQPPAIVVAFWKRTA